MLVTSTAPAAAAAAADDDDDDDDDGDDDGYEVDSLINRSNIVRLVPIYQ